MTNMNYYKKGNSVVSSLNKINGLEEITKEEFEKNIEHAKLSNSQNSIVVDSELALNNFASTLASTDTNSIAKIRAAAQQFLVDTEGGE